MAFLTDTHRTENRSAIVALFSAMKADFADYRSYRKTVSELEKLTNRELNDLGLDRSSIKTSAIEAVYGY